MMWRKNPQTPRYVVDVFDSLEPRLFLNAAFDLVGISQLRADPDFASINGAGVNVAVLDTGLDRTHIRIAPNYRGGINIADGGSDPVDRQDHGTHVGGIIAAADPEIGVASGAGLVGVKVLGDNGSGSTIDIRDGLRWVYDNRITLGIQIVNMSLGSGFFTSVNQVSGDIILTEVRRLEAAGITVVAAGGNSFKNNEYQNFAAPGIFSTLVVGAVWKDGSATNVRWGSGATDFTTGPSRITSFSQRLVASNTIFAPGAFIRSTVPGNGYENMGGTSQAAPVVAGSVALMQQAAQVFGGRALSPTEVREIINTTAVTIFDGDDEDDNVNNTQVNYRRIDVYAAVKEVRRRLTTNSPPPVDPGTTVSDANGNLVGAFLVNPTLDGSETFTAPGRIGTDFGTSLIGPTDVDMFKFTTAAKGKVTIRLSPNATTPENFDSFLRLFNANGVQIDSDDNAGGDGYSLIELDNLDAGTYYAGVSGKGNDAYQPAGAGRTDGAVGTYTIEISLSNDDPNGLFAGAVEVNFGTDLAPTSFLGLIGADYGRPVGRADVDMFKITAPDDGTITVDIDTPSASGYVDSYIRVFDEQGIELGFADDTSAPDEFTSGNLSYDRNTQQPVGHFTDSFLAIGIQRGKVYYVAVSDYNNRTYNPDTLEGRIASGAGGTYTIFLKFRSVDVDGTISSIPASDALVFPFAGVAGTIGVDFADGIQSQVGDKDVDFYRFRVTKSSLLEVEVNSTSNGPSGGTPFDSVLYLFDSQGTLLATNDDFQGLDPVLQYVVSPGVDYFIAVAGFGNTSFDPYAAGSGTPGEMGDYFLQGRLLATNAVRTISDDTIGYTPIRTLSHGSSIQAALGTDGSFNAGRADVDLYKFIAPDIGFLTVNTDGFQAFSADTFLRIFDANGRELAFNDNRSEESRGSTATARLLKGKTYYIGISGAGDNPRAYSPKKFASASPGSVGTYEVSATFNQIPTLTAVAPMALADAGQPYTITYESLLAEANEFDPEGQDITFVVSRLSTGTLSKNGVPFLANQTRLGPGESLTWTPTAKASGNTRAFQVFANDGIQNSARAVQVTIPVNAAPTVSSVREIRVPAEVFGIEIDYATLANLANDSDRNKDAITFRIDSVLSGSLLLNGEQVIPGVSILTPGSLLSYTLPEGATGKFGAFTIRAFDGRINSLVAPTVSLRVGR